MIKINYIVLFYLSLLTSLPHPEYHGAWFAIQYCLADLVSFEGLLVPIQHWDNSCLGLPTSLVLPSLHSLES